jgi:hypothetical protein
MMAAELAACHVPEDLAFPAPAEGYMVSFVAFYDWGFGMPSHRFLHLLQQYYGLELHNVTPSWVLHIAAFITLYEAYLGVDPEFDLSNYFFCIRHPQDPDMEQTVSRAAILHVRSGHGVDPYFDLPMPRSIKGWRNNWFYLRNNVSTSLPVFIGHCLVPLPSCGDGEARKDLGKLQPMRETL